MGSTEVLISEKVEEAAFISALVHALEETDSVGIVRFVKRVNSQPSLGVIYPCIKSNTEYFCFHKLPFAEDLRQYPFAPLDRERAKSQFVPSVEQLRTAENLIKSLDLSNASVDEDG